MRTLTLGSLFDGSGGFMFAGTTLGIRPVWSSEIEPYPCRLTAARFPEVRQLGDIRGIRGDEVEPVDIITFSSPCTDISIAGNRSGLRDGTQSSLFYDAVRIIKEMYQSTHGKYPRFCVWENVTGAFSSRGGGGLPERHPVPLRRPTAGRFNTST